MPVKITPVPKTLKIVQIKVNSLNTSITNIPNTMNRYSLNQLNLSSDTSIVMDVQLSSTLSNTTLNTLEFKKMIYEQAENVNLTISILNIQHVDLLRKQIKLINKEKKTKK
jgi:hypothetical protein